MSRLPKIVIPSKDGIHLPTGATADRSIPTFVGMTKCDLKNNMPRPGEP
jgi:hypothetical protein